MGFQKVESAATHPPCPNSPLFVRHENGDWFFEIPGRLSIPIRAASGIWKHVVGHTAASIWSCEPDCGRERAAWLLWISE